jgi:hypothetical protein
LQSYNEREGLPGMSVLFAGASDFDCFNPMEDIEMKVDIKLLEALKGYQLN